MNHKYDEILCSLKDDEICEFQLFLVLAFLCLFSYPVPRSSDAFEFFLFAFEKQLVKAFFFDLNSGKSETKMCVRKVSVLQGNGESFVGESLIFEWAFGSDEDEVFERTNVLSLKSPDIPGNGFKLYQF